MATLLYRLGRFSFRRAWLVVGVWAVLLVGIIGGSVALGGATEESFAIPGTESQDALDRLNAVFPAVAGTAVQVVTVAPDGDRVTDEQYTEAIEEQVDAIEELDGVEAVVSPFSEYAGRAVTDDESMSFIRVQYAMPSTDVTVEMLDELQDTASITRDAGMEVQFGGQVFADNTFGITVTEVFGVIFAGIVLFITFGSLLAAGMPLLSALIGVGIVVGGISTVSAFTSVSSTAPMLALMIGLAVGIDYTLFILSRHRTQLARGEDPEESAAISVGTAGSAVVFAGVTVIIALLGLLVVGIPFLSTMGVAAAFAVLIAIAVAVTLVPAMLGLAGRRLIPKTGSRAWKRASLESHSSGGLRWVKGVMRFPVLATVAVVVLLGVASIPALSLQLSLPDNGSEPSETTQRQAYDLLSEGFGEGYNGPLIIAVDITQTTEILEDLDDIRADLQKLDGVDYVSQGLPDETLDTAILQVVPETAPDSEETKALVQEIRDSAASIEKEYGTPLFVTGTTAVQIDISNRLSNALIPFGTIVVGLSIILLMMVFRSVLVPIKAALGFLLSVGASFGVVVAVFQWGWLGELLHVENPGPILSFLPILLMAVLFGLAMDYEVFLVSGMREEFVRTKDARHSVAQGFANGARVVTAAALIMFFVFFAFVPEGSGAIKPIALGLAVGIAVDAFIVRMTLVPAVMTLLGRHAWWMPAWLARILPNVDIEGELLREHREEAEWAATQSGIINARDLVVGTAETTVGPIDLDVPAGALLVLAGPSRDRRVLAATLAGRLEPVAGHVQVAGHPLPSEADRVARKVAVADLGADAAFGLATVGELVRERFELTAPVRRVFSARETAEALVDRINVALLANGSSGGVSVDAPMLSLAPFDRAVVVASLALIERTPVVVIDGLDGVDGERLAVTVLDLAAPAATIVLASSAVDIADRIARGRPVVVTNLFAPAQLEGTNR